MTDWDGSSATSGLPFIQGNAEFGSRHPQPTKLCLKPLKCAEPGDTLLSVRAPVGATSRASTRLAIGRGVAAIRFRGASAEFGWHALNHAKAALERLAQGSTFDAIGADVIRSLELPLPVSRDEQRDIATILDAIDDAIERTEAVIAATESLRQAVLHELLTSGIPAWHAEWKHAQNIGTIPTNWSVTTLGALCEPPEYGAAAPSTEYDPELPRYVRITDITEGGRLAVNGRRSAHPALVRGYELRDGDLLFARSGATVGKTYLYRTQDGDCVFAGYLIRFRALRARVTPDFLALWTTTRTYRRWIERVLHAGAQPNISATEYASLPVPCPPLDEQERIVRVVRAIEARRDAQVAQCRSLRLLASAAADALLRGRVRTLSREAHAPGVA